MTNYTKYLFAATPLCYELTSR